MEQFFAKKDASTSTQESRVVQKRPRMGGRSQQRAAGSLQPGRTGVGRPAAAPARPVSPNQPAPRSQDRLTPLTG